MSGYGFARSCFVPLRKCVAQSCLATSSSGGVEHCNVQVQLSFVKYCEAKVWLSPATSGMVMLWHCVVQRVLCCTG